MAGIPAYASLNGRPNARSPPSRRPASEREQRRPSRRTRTVAFAIPEGVDPAVFRLGLDRAGFTSSVGRVDGAECLLVECLTTERAAVRGVLEAAHANAYGGTELDLQHVVFEDERRTRSPAGEPGEPV